MIQVMSDEEVNAWEEIIRQKESGDLTDKIAAILMSTKFGHSGLRQECAEIKAKAIVDLLEKSNI